MRISVITPSYNQVAYLERALRSVHEQEGPFEIEHWVIDGGSTDGTVEMLERWSDKLQYVSEADRGQSHALNKGIERATGEIICWLNSDDLLLPGALAVVADFFRTHAHVRWAYGRCLILDEHDREIRKPITWYKNRLARRYSYTKLLVENYISQQATFFTKELVDEAGGIDESLKYDMDYELWLRFGLICEPGILDADLGAFRFYAECKTGGDIDPTLRAAYEIAKKYAVKIDKPWLAAVNYVWYYKRTSWIYRLLA
ncbi:MAG: glycosyltransferase family 2 protein [Candidatus Lernaella stagnicola]|nr:glycosyltransferase family 2 protein [Candidatus Lernaella stagnicola]